MQNLIAKSIVLLSIVLITATSCTKETAPIMSDNIIIRTDDAIEDLEAYIQDEMESQHIPALSILIFEEDEILYENYFGIAHIEQGIALEEEHPFLLASISKVVTATALLQLEEEGEFELDDAINDYLSFEVEHPDYDTDITFQMLLTHTSGIADSDAASDAYHYGSDHPTALGDFLESYFTEGGDFYNYYENFYDFEPGAEHEYSNIGNALIGLLVEEIAEMDFNDYCKQHIFGPLGMTNTAWRLDEITTTIVQPYEYNNGQFEAIEHYSFPDYPNGGLRSTARDMHIFLSAFVQNGNANNYQLLEASTISNMLTPQIPSLSNDTGLHLFQLDAGNNLWGHSGGEVGTTTIAAFNPTSKVGAIIFANIEDADLVDELLNEAYELGLEW